MMPEIERERERWGGGRKGVIVSQPASFRYLETDDSTIRRPTCRALHRLSLEPENCVTLHQSGAVPVSHSAKQEVYQVFIKTPHYNVGRLESSVPYVVSFMCIYEGSVALYILARLSKHSEKIKKSNAVDD